MAVPAGYTLDKPVKLPPGYTLDSAPQETAAPAPAPTDAPLGVDGKPLPFVGYDKGGTPMYHGTPASAGRYPSNNPAPPPNNWRTALTTMTSHPEVPVHSYKDVLHNLGVASEDVFGNIGSAALTPFLRSDYTVQQILRQISDPLQATTELSNQAIEHPQETAEGAIGQAAAFGGMNEIRDSVLNSIFKASDSIPRPIRSLIEKTRETQRLARESADEYANDLHTKIQEIDRDQSNARKTAKAKAIEDQRVYQRNLETARNTNAAALRTQSKIAPTQAKLDTAIQEFQAQIETARERSRGVGNKYFNGVNAKLNPLPADMETVTNGLTDSFDKIKGTESEPTILKAISKRVEQGDALTYEDLQGFYSELGNEISKGTLPGDIYAAYDSMHETIGKDMQRIADSQGMSGQLLNARNYWRRMKQTFGKPYNPTDAANLVLDKTAGPAAQRMEQANRLRLLGSFDRTIPQTALHIANLQKGIASLPKEMPVRDVVQQLPQRPGPVQLPKFEGTPEELAQQTTKLPKSPGKTVIDKNDIVDANKKAYAKGVKSAERWTLYLGVVWPAIETLRYLITKGEPPTIASGLSIGSVLAARTAMDKIFTNPHVVDFFTKATPKEIAAVPPELRGDLPKIIVAAQKRGLHVSPALATLGAVSARQITPQQAMQAVLAGGTQ